MAGKIKTASKMDVEMLHMLTCSVILKTESLKDQAENDIMIKILSESLRSIKESHLWLNRAGEYAEWLNDAVGQTPKERKERLTRKVNERF